MQVESDCIMILKNLVWPYKEKKESGLLSVKVEGNEHLLKIYFEFGVIVGLSMGTLKNESCLDSVLQCRPVDATFIKGYKAPDFALAKKEEAGKLEKIFATYPVVGGTIEEGDTEIVKVTAQNLDKLEKDFIDIMGPIGKMLINAFYLEFAYHRGNTMLSPQYSLLVEKLKAELPEQQRASFGAKYAIGLALHE